MIILSDVMQSIFGVYSPILDSSGVPVAGFAGVDWQYICSVLLFGLVVWGFLRCLLSVIRKGGDR